MIRIIANEQGGTDQTVLDVSEITTVQISYSVAELGDVMSVYKVNIDENPDTPAKYNIRGIPTLVIFKDGAPAGVKVGALPKASLTEWVNSVIAA